MKPIPQLRPGEQGLRLWSRDADVDGTVQNAVRFPNRTVVQYIKNGGFLIGVENFCFSC